MVAANWPSFDLTTMKRFLLCSVLLLSLAPARFALAQSVWIGASATTSNWSDPANWQANNIPQSGADIHFQGSNRTTNFDDNPPNGMSIGSIEFDANAASFSLQGLPVSFFGAGSSSITNNSTARQFLAFSDNGAFGGITLGGVGATIDAAAGDFQVTSNVRIYQFGGPSGPSVNLTFTGAHDIQMSGTISEGVPGNPGGIIKDGSGTLGITAGNSYTGGTTLNAGFLIVANGDALGSVSPTPQHTNDFLLHGGTLQTDTPREFNVPGNYLQNGGTLRLQIGGLASGVDSDLMHVALNANLGGNLFIHQFNGFMPTNGDRVTVITSPNVNGTFASFADDFPGLITATPEYFSDHVDIVFGIGSFIVPGLTPNQIAVARALNHALIDNCAPALTNFISSLPVGSFPAAFELIAPDELASIYDIGFSQAVVYNENLMRRMDDIRAGTNGYCGPVVEIPTGKDANPPIQDKNVIADKNAVPTTSVLPPEECKWNVFATGFGDFASINDDDDNAPGYDIRTGGVIAGVDRRFGDHFAIGLDGSYSGSSADLVNDGRVDVDGGKGGAYATVFGKGFFGSRFYVDGAVGGGWNNYDTRRTTLARTSSGLGDARAHFDGSEFDGLVAYGADWNFNCFNVGTWSTFQYTKIDIDSHDETGSVAPLHFPDQDQDSVRTTTGLHASYDIRSGRMLIRPEIRAAWMHEYGNRGYAIDARFLDCDHGFSVHGPDIGRDAALVGAGLSVQFSRCCAVYAYYDGVLGRSNYDNNAVSGGLRFGF